MLRMKPTAIGITDWYPYKEVVYKCSNCGQDFRMLGDRERFCHTCGTQVDWKNVIRRLPKPFTKTGDLKAEKELVAKINRDQLSGGK